MCCATFLLWWVLARLLDKYFLTAFNINLLGYSVTVLESHYLPGGVAHTFEKDGFKFDAGPSLWNGMATKPYNLQSFARGPR